MMLTFKAKGGTEFFYDTSLETGEVWITAPEAPEIPKEYAMTAVIPAADLIQFAAHLAAAAIDGGKHDRQI